MYSCILNRCDHIAFWSDCRIPQLLNTTDHMIQGPDSTIVMALYCPPEHNMLSQSRLLPPGDLYFLWSADYLLNSGIGRCSA